MAAAWPLEGGAVHSSGHSRAGAYDPGMRIAASVFVGLAALLHVYIFWMESIAWTRPEIWKRFSVADQAAADVTRRWPTTRASTTSSSASGRLSVSSCGGPGHDIAGRRWCSSATGSMVAAAAVLVTTGRRYLRAALTQGTLPLLGFLADALRLRPADSPQDVGAGGRGAVIASRAR